MPSHEPISANVETRVIETASLQEKDLERVHGLFDLSYREANHSYLEKSFSKLKYIALATREDDLVGFALAKAIKTHLPRLEGLQTVTLAGICCVDSSCRRMGLFKTLEILAADVEGLLSAGGRVLMCGRMAHPVSFRTMRGFPSVIPKAGVPLSDWHKEMGLRVAELYGVSIDPETLVVNGEGAPIGYPNLDYEVAEEEWVPFKNVNRDRGDALLGIFWAPDAPEGW